MPELRAMTTERPHPVLIWAPRVVAMLLTIFVASFSLDAVREGPAALFVHLVPAVFLALVIAASWNDFQWFAGVVFIALSIFYTLIARRHLDWLLVVAAPLAAVGLLYLASWRFGHAQAART